LERGIATACRQHREQIDDRGWFAGARRGQADHLPTQVVGAMLDRGRISGPNLSVTGVGSRHPSGSCPLRPPEGLNLRAALSSGSGLLVMHARNCGGAGGEDMVTGEL